jgi:hypothetical protein
MLRILLAVLCLLFVAPAGGAEPVRIIFDTDMDSDCDDAGALALLHALGDRGEAEILATVVSSDHPWSGPCVDAINTYFGRPDLPIGAPQGSGRDHQGSRFARRIAEEFPHDLPSETAAPDATQVYRRTLSAQPDHSVVIVTVGDLTNLRYLLESPADEQRSLSGTELVRRKVKRWVCMGSRYPADRDPGRWGNFKLDPESTVKAIEGWPASIVFTGGGAFAESLATGRGLAKAPQDNPVRRVYELYFGGEPRNRHSADQVAVLIAVRGAGDPWRQVIAGYNQIFPNGTHEWRETPDNPRHSYVSALAEKVEPRHVAATIEELMLHTPAIQ